MTPCSKGSSWGEDVEICSGQDCVPLVSPYAARYYICNDLDGVRAEHCGARVYLGNYCFGAEPAAAHSTP